ncbi:MAG TPA: HAD-IA family hydrolase [Anaerolineae bacterium]|nr:HAD-IA family hydrolase [Anaerolineae bacterium]
MSGLKGIFFDQDGVIIDTEKDGHRVAFNQTFKSFGYSFQWDVGEYHKLLQVAGGKERMRHYLHTKGFGKVVKPEEEDELIKKLHKYKTERFIELIEIGALPLRPGIKRLMKDANKTGVLIGICTTSNERAANAIAYKILKDINFNFVLAGDMVNKKKPDPEIYNLAIQTSGINCDDCVVIEDSRNGLLAAKAAGLRVVVTTNYYTEKEDLSEADLIVTCLGDPDGERGKLIKSQKQFEYDGILDLEQINKYFYS